MSLQEPKEQVFKLPPSDRRLFHSIHSSPMPKRLSVPRFVF